MDDDALRRRQAAGQRALYRLMTPAAPGGRVVELADGAVQAAVAPAVPDRSIFNAVVYDDPAAVVAAWPQLDALYDAAGVRAWTVWVHPGDEELAPALQAAGHAFDGRPLLMAAELGALDLAPRAALELVRPPSWADVAEINDAAYGLRPGTMGPALTPLRDERLRPWVASVDGAAAAVLVILVHAGDAYVAFVATRPQARGRGLASELMRTALRAARDEDGAVTTSLEASPLGEPIYARLGYRALGRTEMWEKRRRS